MTVEGSGGDGRGCLGKGEVEEVGSGRTSSQGKKVKEVEKASRRTCRICI